MPRLRPPATWRSTARTAGGNNCLNPASPCLTLKYAIEQQAGYGDTLKVAQGTYVENIKLNAPLHLEGGYQNNTWNRDINLYETIIDGSNSRGTPGDWDGTGVGLPAVVAVPGGFLMSYDARGIPFGWAHGAASSPDGVNWTKYAGNPTLLPAGGDTAWDNWFRGQVALLLDNGTFKMWYSGAGGPWQTGYATSPDAHSWTIYPSNPVVSNGATGSWEEGNPTGRV